MFRAELVGAEEMPDLNSYALVIAEGDQDNSARMELSIALATYPQDVSLGMDTYSLCTETGACHYGGVESWSLRNNYLEIVLSSDACAVLDIKEGFRIALSEQQIPIVLAAMERILGNSATAN